MEKVISPCFCKVYTCSGNKATERRYRPPAERELLWRCWSVR